MVSFYELVLNTLATMFPNSASCVAKKMAEAFCVNGNIYFPTFDNEGDAVKFIVCNFIHPCGDCDWLGLCCYDLPWCLNCYDAGKVLYKLIQDIKAGNVTIDSCLPPEMTTSTSTVTTTSTTTTTTTTPTTTTTETNQIVVTDPSLAVAEMTKMMMDVTTMQIMMNIVKQFFDNMNILGGGNDIQSALKPLMELIPLVLIIEVI